MLEQFVILGAKDPDIRLEEEVCGETLKGSAHCVSGRYSVKCLI